MMCLMVVHVVWCAPPTPRPTHSIPSGTPPSLREDPWRARGSRLTPLPPHSRDRRCTVILFVYERAHQGLEARCGGEDRDDVVVRHVLVFLPEHVPGGLDLAAVAEGTILEPNKRTHINTLLYMHFTLTIADVCFTALGTLLDYHVGNSCYVRNHVHTAIVVAHRGQLLHHRVQLPGRRAHLQRLRALAVRGALEQDVRHPGLLPVHARRERPRARQPGHALADRDVLGEVFQGADLAPSDTPPASRCWRCSTGVRWRASRSAGA